MKHRTRLDKLAAHLGPLTDRGSSGVVELPAEEFEEARQEWPQAQPGEAGCLLVPEACATLEEWLEICDPMQIPLEGYEG